VFAPEFMIVIVFSFERFNARDFPEVWKFSAERARSALRSLLRGDFHIERKSGDMDRLELRQDSYTRC
jgi:hypothetical protein